MPMKSKSQTTTKDVVGRRLPRNRPPTHPGEMLFEEFVKPLDITQAELSRRLGVSYPRLNEIIKGKRSVTPDTALRLSRVLGMSADFWLGLQQDWDLWHAMNSPDAKQIKRLINHPIRLGIRSIDFVDDYNRFEMQLQRFFEDKFGLWHGSFEGVDQE